MISRRDVLKAGAGVALAPVSRALASLSQPGSFSFAFFSDTHVGLETNLAENASMFKEMAEGKYAFGINGGDVTDYGWPDQYVNYRTLIKALPFQVHAAPGNHDVRWSPLGPIAFREGTGCPMYGSFDHEGVHFVTLDSTIPLSHYGHFEANMLRWLEHDLSRCGRETPVFLAFHHWVGRDGNQVDDDIDLYRIIEPYNVKILLNAHGHSDLLWTWNGILNTMNKGLYQLSYERIDVDREKGQVRLSRRTKEQPEMQLLATVDLAPLKEKRPIWSLLTHPDAKEYRWDDRPWLAVTGSSVPTEQLCTGFHRLTFRRDPSTYFPAGDHETPQSGNGSTLGKRWEQKLDGGVMSHLRLSDDQLLVSTMSGELCALHADTGRRIWTARTGGYCHSSPLVLKDAVIVGSADRYVHAFDRSNGKELWRFETHGPVYASAAEAHGVAAIGSGDGAIYGLDAATGKLRWRFDLPASHTAFVQSPACTDGDRFYFGAWDKNLYALDVQTGKLVWRYDCCGPAVPFAYSPAIGGPVVGAGKVYVPTDGNLLLAFDAATGKQLWKTYPPGDKVGYSGPCLVGDRIFVGCLGDIGQARCFSALDGSILWTALVGSTIYDSSPSHADGIVAIGSVIGLLTTMSAQDGKILGRYQLPPGHFLSSPVSSPGRVYAASYCNRVFAFDLQMR